MKTLAELIAFADVAEQQNVKLELMPADVRAIADQMAQRPESGALIRFLEAEYVEAERRFHAVQRALNHARGLAWAVDSLSSRLEIVSAARAETSEEQ